MKGNNGACHGERSIPIEFFLRFDGMFEREAAVYIISNSHQMFHKYKLFYDNIVVNISSFKHTTTRLLCRATIPFLRL